MSKKVLCDHCRWLQLYYAFCGKLDEWRCTHITGRQREDGVISIRIEEGRLCMVRDNEKGIGIVAPKWCQGKEVIERKV